MLDDVNMLSMPQLEEGSKDRLATEHSPIDVNRPQIPSQNTKSSKEKMAVTDRRGSTAAPKE